MSFRVLDLAGQRRPDEGQLTSERTITGAAYCGTFDVVGPLATTFSTVDAVVIDVNRVAGTISREPLRELMRPTPCMSVAVPRIYT